MMKKIGKVILPFCFACLSMHVRAQVYGTSFQNLVKVGTASPEAASVSKFGNIPVSYCTGIPGITVPIYKISLGKVAIPISLDYHSGGIRVDETSSSIGIGWGLNGVGIISRTMIGRPDELGAGGSYVGSPNAQSVANSPQSYFSFLYAYENNQNNVEPDIFQYSVNGLSGKFIYRNDGTFMQIPVTNNKIVFSGGNFTITDPEGNSYIFEEKRQISSSDVNFPPYINTWCQTKMIAANLQDTIYFKYESTPYQTYEKNVNYSMAFGYELAINSIQCAEPPYAGGEQVVANQDLGPHQSSQQFTHQEYYPKEINWRGGKIIFININDRMDITGSGLRMDEIDIYSSNGGSYELLQRKKLNQSYFFSNLGGSITEKNYRLKLDKVDLLDKNSNGVGETYRMDYNAAPMAPRESYAQDRWGFYNGQNNNVGLMPTQTQLYNGMYYTFGTANRETDPTAILAGTLSSIEYPTKGKTVFEFEPHQYHTSIISKSLHTLSATACCSTSSTTQQTFAVNSNQSNFRYNVFISKFNYPDVTDRPRVKLTDITTGALVMQISTIPTTATNLDYSTGTVALNLISGHSYILDVNIYTLNANVSATGTISWEEPIAGASDIRLGGGLRVKSLTNLGIDGNFIGKEIYTYGNDNTGTALTPQYYQDMNYEQLVHRAGYLACGVGGCSYLTEQQLVPWSPGYTTIYHANSVLPTSQYSGSPVLYPSVTKTQVDPSGNPSGKTVYTYSVYEDGSFSPFQPITGNLTNYYPNAGMILINKTWKNGMLLTEEISKSIPGGYQLISKKTNVYAEGLSTFQNVLKVKLNYVHKGCEIQGSVADFTLSVVPIYTGAMLLNSSTYLYLDNNGNQLSRTTNFTYGTTPLQPSKIEVNSSKSQILTQNLLYSKDLSLTGNVYEKMVNRNIISPIVKSIDLNNGIQTSLQSINYNDWFANSKLLVPQTIDQQIASFTNETRINYNQYDSYGNILEQQKTSDVKEVFLWGYNSVYPVAKITNTTSAVAKTYITQSILDNPTDDLTLRNHLNNLRSIPGAFVTTYTYKPLVGMTSQTDANSHTVYYTYDAFNRLQLIKDQDGKIVKKICYNYAGQVEDCSISVAPLWTATGNLRCATSGGVNTGYQEAEQRDNNPNSPTYNQLQWVSNGYNTTACPLPAPPCTLSANSGFSLMTSSMTSSAGVVSFYMVFSSTSPMIVGNSYTVATISGGCKPSVNRTINYTTAGGNWVITIYTTGQVSWYLSSLTAGGTSISAYTTIGTNTLTYNL
jgi:YD repeat-containing protein